MAVTFARQRIRLVFDLSNLRADALDYMTGQSPLIFRGTDVAFEITGFWGSPDSTSSDVLAITNLSSLTLEVFESNGGTLVMTETVDVGAMNTALTKTDFIADGTTPYHALAAFANDETAPSLGTNVLSRDYYGVVTVVTNDASPREITWGQFTLTIEEDGHGAVTTPPLGDPQYLTSAETQALIAAARVNTLHLYNQTTGLYCELQIQGAGDDRTIIFGNEIAL